tara:strand:+ start:1024 stop:1287 length:264 start_codon:yes stop_codon:yes gene_type:complete
VVVATKRKTKRKLAPAAENKTAVLIHLDTNTIARLQRFQSYMSEENGISMKNAPSVKFLISQGLKEFEKSNKQLNLMGEIAGKKKKK